MEDKWLGIGCCAIEWDSYAWGLQSMCEEECSVHPHMLPHTLENGWCFAWQDWPHPVLHAAPHAVVLALPHTFGWIPCRLLPRGVGTAASDGMFQASTRDARIRVLRYGIALVLQRPKSATNLLCCVLPRWKF